MATRRPKRPRDPSQLGKLIVDISVGDREDQPTNEDGNPAAVAFARLGGLKGGRARAASLSVDERKRIAKNAAEARWKRKRDSSD